MVEWDLKKGLSLLKTQPHAQNRELIMELNDQTTRKPVLNGMSYTNKLTKIFHEMLRHVIMFFFVLFLTEN